MVILDDVRETYLQVLDAADHIRSAACYSDYTLGIAQGYNNMANALKAILEKYDCDDYNDHEPLT